MILRCGMGCQNHSFGSGGEKTTTSDSKGGFSSTTRSRTLPIKAEATGFKPTEIKQVAVLSDKPSASESGSKSVVLRGCRGDRGGSRRESNQVAGATPAAESPLARCRTGDNGCTAQLAEGCGLRAPGAGSATDPERRRFSGHFAGRCSPAPETAARAGKRFQLAPAITFRALSAVGAISGSGKAGACTTPPIRSNQSI